MQPTWKFLKNYGVYILLLIVVALYQTASRGPQNKDSDEYSRSNYEKNIDQSSKLANSDDVNETKY